MKFGLAITTSYGIKTNAITSLSDEMMDYFENKDYGSDIKSYTIGIICVSPQFDQFYKNDKKPKYTKGKKIIKPDGIPFELEDSFEYQIKLDFDSFKDATDFQAKSILTNDIINSLYILDNLNPKIKNFDAIQFKADLINFFIA